LLLVLVFFFGRRLKFCFIAFPVRFLCFFKVVSFSSLFLRVRPVTPPSYLYTHITNFSSQPTRDPFFSFLKFPVLRSPPPLDFQQVKVPCVFVPSSNVHFPYSFFLKLGGKPNCFCFAPSFPLDPSICVQLCGAGQLDVPSFSPL